MGGIWGRSCPKEIEDSFHHRDTEEHGGPQRTATTWVTTVRHAGICVAFAVHQRSCGCRSLWPFVLLCVFVIKGPRSPW